MSYSSEVLTDTPDTWLKMDELADGSLADSSGNGNTFAQSVASGTRTYGVTTPSGKAIQFDTVGSRYSRFSPNRDIDFFSFEVVVKPPDATDNYIIWAATESAVYDSTGYDILIRSGKIAVFDGGGSGHNLSDAAFNDGNFHHCVITWDGTTFLGYVDGVLQTATYTPGGGITALNGGRPISIGREVPGTIEGAAGGLAFGDLAFYHSVLNSTRVSAHYAAFAGGPQDVVVPFISSGTTVYDPTLTGGNADVVAPFIPSSTVLYTMNLMDAQFAAVPFIGPSTVLYTMLLTYPQNATVPFISAATTLYTPVLHRPPPVITTFTPGGAGPGVIITILGENFTGTTSVTFAGVSATFFVDADGVVRAQVPAGPVYGALVLTTPEGAAVAPFDFTIFIAAPTDLTARRFRQPYQWRFIFTDLDSVTTTMPNDLLTSRHIGMVLNQSTVIEASIFPDDFRINGIWDDGYPRVAQSKRLVYCLRREVGANPPWKCRAAGILMSPQDEGDTDLPVSHFTAYDPWKYLEALPVVNGAGFLPGPNGYQYLAQRGNVIAIDILNNTLTQLAGEDTPRGVYIDAGTGGGGTIYWEGVIQATPRITFQIQQGTFVADAWGQLCDAGNLDIILKPIYDPVRRPGYTHELSIFNLAGTERRDSIFAWNRLTRNLARIDRMHDGTPGSFFNTVQYYAGQGGPPVPAAGPLKNVTSRAAFGDYWSQQFFPNQTSTDPTGAAVLAMAVQALEMAKQGKRTLTLTPVPTRAPIPLVDYGLGDRVPVYASKALRVTADGLQRIEGIPIEIDDDGVERVNALLVAPDWRGSGGEDI